MNNQFLSITDAAEHYQVSINTIRRIVQKIKHTEHVKQVSIKGRHGFKYVVSVNYLDSIYNSKNSSNNNQKDNQLNNQNDNQLNNLQRQVDRQNVIIEKLTDTVNEQNKVIISQSMQIHQLTTTTTTAPAEHGRTTFENVVISILVVCIIAIMLYLFR